MRTVVLTLYCFGVLVATLLILSRDGAFAPDFKATAELAPNRLLQPGDLAPSPLTDGYYVVGKVEGGRSVSAENLSSLPSIRFRADVVPTVVPVARVLVDAGTINAAAAAKVCDQSKSALTVTVQAVLCRPGVADCLAVADLPADKLSELSKSFDQSGPRLRGANDAC